MEHERTRWSKNLVPLLLSILAALRTCTVNWKSLNRLQQAKLFFEAMPKHTDLRTGEVQQPIGIKFFTENFNVNCTELGVCVSLDGDGTGISAREKKQQQIQHQSEARQDDMQQVQLLQAEKAQLRSLRAASRLSKS